jgi:hypothetical protein
LQQSLAAFLEENTKQAAEYNGLVELSQKMVQEGITSNPYASFTIDDITER